MESSKQHSPIKNNNTDAEKFDFSSVMAVAIHDMKNSLSLLLQSIDQLASIVKQDDPEINEGINSVHYEANRMNTTLVQILSLYRSEMDALPLNIDESFLIDLVEEVVESNRVRINQKNINIHINVDEELAWYIDSELVYLLVHDVLINAIRYGCQNITITAENREDNLYISVKDDGQGYPQAMLDMATVKLNNFCISEGRTGLGLFFARLIAQAHSNNGVHGSIALSNDPDTGGSVFELVLP